jgi:hypothetical protein
MPLDTTQANTKTESINIAFDEIGYANGTAIPRGTKDKREAAAWEYHWASHLLRIAEIRRRKAAAECVKLGVMFDPKQDPLPVGTNATVFAGKLVEIAVQVAAPIERIDFLPLWDLLEKKFKLPRAKLDAVIADHTYELPAAHKFITSLVTR